MNRCLTRTVLRAKSLYSGMHTLSRQPSVNRNLIQNKIRRHMSNEIPGPHLLTEGGVTAMLVPSFIAVLGVGTVMWVKLLWFDYPNSEAPVERQGLVSLVSEAAQPAAPATPAPATAAPATAAPATAAPATAAETTAAATSAPEKSAPSSVPAPVVEEAAEVPAHAQYLIIGAGTAAHAAFQAIKAKDSTAKVLVVGQENHTPYVRPPLSKQLWYKTKPEEVAKALDKDNSKGIYYEPSTYYFDPKDLTSQENGGIAVLTGKKVVKLDGDNKAVYLDDGSKISYDKCLISTGGTPRNLPVFEKASKDVQDRTIVFRTIEDYKRLDEATKSAKSVVVIGGGFLGSEIACALGFRGKSTGLNVQQVFPEEGNLGMVLPTSLSKYASSKLQNVENVNVIPQKTVTGVEFSDGQVVLTLNDDSKLQADQVVVAVGLEPNTQLAKTGGLEVDPVRGGYLVNAELEARSNIWVAGDAACFYDHKLGRRRVEHHDHAVVSGRLAGRNMTGAAKPYTHQSMFWSDLGKSVSFEAMGLIDSKLPTESVFAKDEPVEGQEGQDNFSKGVAFYKRDNAVVGVLTWNISDKMEVARKIIQDGAEGEDPLELAKLFDMKVVKDIPVEVKV